MGSRARCAVTFAVAVVVTLALAPSAGAVVRTVNSTADDSDGACTQTTPPTPTSDCTLREAMDATGADASADAINFNVPGCTSGTPCEILVSSALPPVANVVIDGCSSNTASAQPCYGLRASSPGLVQAGITALGSTSVHGLAFSGFNEGIFNLGASLKLYNNWFGIRLNGTAEANGIGLHSLAAGDEMRIGALADAPPNRATRNVFANSTSQGLRIEGSDGAIIEGNYFGLKPDGTPASPGNGENLEVVARLPSTGTADFPTQIDIGGTVGEAAAATSQCDGACNVISGATGHGIDLAGDADELPGSDIDIRGNFVGLTPDGSAANGNGDAANEDGDSGIDVGAADDVTVGGPTAGDRNYVAGNDDEGIDAGPGAGGLVIEGNFVGLDSTGAAALPDTGSGIRVFGVAEVRGNRLGGNGTAPENGMNLSGGSEVEGNIVGIGVGGQKLGPVKGISTFGSSGPDIGGDAAGEGNTIGNASGSAIDADADRTTVVGNRLGVDGSGSAHPNGAGVVISEDQMTIGGDTAAEENVISNSAGNPIEVRSGNDDDNLIARNRGSGNGAEFIDLNANGPGNPPTGANQGAQAPVITSASETHISGTAPAGSLVRLFRSPALPNDIDSFVAQVTADASGQWAVTHSSPVQAGERFAATQTTTQGTAPPLHNTSELSAPATTADTVPPDTAITSGPSGTTADSTPAFEFTSSEPSSTFACRIDGANFAPCASPHTTGELANGAHTFEVRAIDAAGNPDPTPASRTFTVEAVVIDPPVVDPPVVLSGVSVTNPVFRVGTPAPLPTRRRRPTPRGTHFRYTLSEAARVTITIERAAPGRRVGRRCRPPSRQLRNRPPCTRWVRAGDLTTAGAAGRNTTPFSGRLGRRKIGPGRYRATLVATDAAGARSAESRVSFRVVRR